MKNNPQYTVIIVAASDSVSKSFRATYANGFNFVFIVRNTITRMKINKA